MRGPSSLKQEFLKKWIKGLQKCNSSSKKMNLLERKNAIKLSADIAMASARNGSTCWSRAILIANASSSDDNVKRLVDHIHSTEKLNNYKSTLMMMRNKRVNRCKKILKRSCNGGAIRRRRVALMKKKKKNVNDASCIAKRLVKKRTELLKSLVPGGEFMDEVSLIEETLDYILSLRTQIDVMKSLANANYEFVNCT